MKSQTPFLNFAEFTPEQAQRGTPTSEVQRVQARLRARRSSRPASPQQSGHTRAHHHSANSPLNKSDKPAPQQPLLPFSTTFPLNADPVQTAERLPLPASFPAAKRQLPIVAAPVTESLVTESLVTESLVTELLPTEPASTPADPGAMQRATLAKLAREVRKLETSGRIATTEQAPLSTGCAALDACLPTNGYPAGCIVEYLRATSGSGASQLAFTAAAAAAQSTAGFIVVIDTLQTIYPPALCSLGIDLEQVIFVRPESQADAIWATDQALRTPAVAAVVAELPRIDDRSARRLQLAAERGRGLGLLLRPITARQGPSWAEVQWVVRSLNTIPTTSTHPTQNQSAQHSAHESRQRPHSPLANHHRLPHSAEHRTNTPIHTTTFPQTINRHANRYLQVQLARVRGGKSGAITQLEINATTGLIQPVQHERNRHEHQIPATVARPIAATNSSALRLASELADSKNPSRKPLNQPAAIQSSATPTAQHQSAASKRAAAS